MENIKSENRTITKSYIPWLVWGLGCAFYFYETVLRTSPNVMSHELMRDFSISAATMSLLGSFYFWTYALLQVPAGLFLDKLGPHRLLTYSAFVCGLGAIIFGAANWLSLASLGRFLIGFGSAFAAIGTMKLAATWFPASRFTILTGLMVSCGSLGGFLGEKPLALSVDHFGWRMTIIVLGIIGLVLAFIIYQIVRDDPEHNPKAAEKQPTESMEHILADLRIIAKNPQFWFTAIYGGLMFAPAIVFCDFWSAAFLMAKFSITKASAAWLASMVYMGLIVGSPIGGYISDTMRRRKPNMIVAAIGCLVCSVLVIYAPLSMTECKIVLFLFGMFTAGFLPAFSIVREICPQNSTATALGLMNMMNMIFIVFMAPIIGFLLDKMHDGTLTNGTPIFTYANYQSAMILLPGSLVIALLILPFIKETYCEVTGKT